MAENMIVSNPQILDGKPCVRGTRLSVEFLLELVASGATQEQLLSSILTSRRTASQRHSGTTPTCSRASTPGS